jgi:hypothetical protein
VNTQNQAFVLRIYPERYFVLNFFFVLESFEGFDKDPSLKMQNEQVTH